MSIPAYLTTQRHKPEKLIPTYLTTGVETIKTHTHNTHVAPVCSAYPHLPNLQCQENFFFCRCPRYFQNKMQQAMTITITSRKQYNEFEYVSTFVKSFNFIY